MISEVTLKTGVMAAENYRNKFHLQYINKENSYFKL